MKKLLLILLFLLTASCAYYPYAGGYNYYQYPYYYGNYGRYGYGYYPYFGFSYGYGEAIMAVILLMGGIMVVDIEAVTAGAIMAVAGGKVVGLEEALTVAIDKKAIF